MRPPISAKTRIAGVVGAPVRHSLSPLIHNAWLESAGLDAVYAAFEPPADRFAAFIDGLRGGVVLGLNVTVPFKETALAMADEASARSKRAGAANLLRFEPDGRVLADNTDGEGLLAALAAQAPSLDLTAGPALVLGAGGAARGAVAALLDAGAPKVRLVNRTQSRAGALAASLNGPIEVCASAAPAALSDVALIVNATTLGLGGGAGPEIDFADAAPTTVVMDMVYRPLRTQFLGAAARRGLATADGLEMLIGQAAPSFEAFFGARPPALDVRSLCLRALQETP
jgi:shikimate dehydrogenase